MSTAEKVTSGALDSDAGSKETEAPRRRRLRVPGLENYSGLYVWAALLILFAFWIPNLFYTVVNFQVIAQNQALYALVALALVIPMTTGTFDLSVGGVVGLSLTLLAWLQIHTSIPFVLLIVIVLMACVLIGCVNSLIIIRFRVFSMIATLAMGSILLGLVIAITKGQQILPETSHTFQALTTDKVFGVPLVFLIMLAIAAVIWFVLEQMPVGRYLYATGGNARAARLTGVRTDRLVFGSLIASSLLSGVVGVLTLSSIGIADPTIGPPLLLPAFAGAFLGATQIKNGRVNAWGTVVAIYVLATGIQGLQLAGAQAWVSEVFYGVALATAVALASARGSDAARGH